MIDRKHIVVALLAAIAFVGPQAEARSKREAAPAAATGEASYWMTDAGAARRRAKAENKPYLYFFTGSDWCPYCKLLVEEVFSTPQFRQYAAKNLIVVEVDMPRRKPQPRDLKRQNEKLTADFNISSWPTVLVFNPKGRQLGKIGYREGGAGPWLKDLDAILRH
jgi:thioredoxin-related protein